METLLDPSIWAGLLTLIVLEVVLGIDNLVFIAILADKLPPHQRDRARLLGLTLALVMRLVLLACIAWIVGLTAPVLSVAGWDFSWRDIILAGGGVFLLVKATMEIHERLEGKDEHGSTTGAHAAFWVVIVQILALDAVFSLDSIITAVGMVEHLWVMMTAVVVAMTIMIIASKPLTAFVGRHPTVIILCLSFLLLIGFSLVAEGFGFHLPKGYLYAAIGFSILIEAFNQISSRNRRRALDLVPLRQRAADSIYRLLTPREKLAEHGGTTGDDGETREEEDSAFQPAEREMIHGVIALAELPVSAVMTARPDIFWIDIEADAQESLSRLIESGRTRVLLARGQIDEFVGVAETRLILPSLMQGDTAIERLAERPLIVSEAISALRLTDIFRETGERFAVVADGYGNIEGVVSTTDIFAAIAGDLAEDEDLAACERIDDRTIEADATIPLGDVTEALGQPPLAISGRYGTLGGYLLFEFGRMPDVGETLERDGLHFKVKSVLASRIDKVEVAVAEAA